MRIILNRKIFWVYLISFLYILINGLFIYKELYYLCLIPIALLIVLMAFFALDKLVMLIVFFTPLSIPLKEIIPHLDFDMFIPTEPLLLGILLVFIFKSAFEQKFDRKILLHPVSIMIYFYLIWVLITSITSTIPVVSFKFLLTKVWYVIAFYFLAIQMFKDQKKMYVFIWLYIIPLIIVIAYTIIRHTQYGIFNQKAANFVVNPFYNDHTSYGAALAMFFPVLIGFLISKRYTPLTKVFIWIIVVIFIAAIVFSYTRATWVSLFIALMILFVVLLRIKFRYIFILIATAVTLFIVYRTDIIISMEGNRHESSKNLSEHLESISNVTSDASNLERLNRWSCAIRMFKQKPVFGWGPGTYMFKYAPFQLSYEKTIISTNAGDLGNAHSEYLGPLSESGLLGMIFFLAIVCLTIFYALKVYAKIKDRPLKVLIISVFISLITYYIHGLLNNFLDTDKASVPFWGFTAMIVAMDIFYLNKQENSIDDNQKNSMPIMDTSSKND